MWAETFEDDFDNIQNIQENVEMQVFLNKDLSKNEVTKISKPLSSKDYIFQKDTLTESVATFVTSVLIMLITVVASTYDTLAHF